MQNFCYQCLFNMLFCFVRISCLHINDFAEVLKIYGVVSNSYRHYSDSYVISCKNIIFWLGPVRLCSYCLGMTAFHASTNMSYMHNI